MGKSRLRHVAKQHDVFAGAIVLGVLVSVRASFWLDKKIQKLFECFNEYLPKTALIPPTDMDRESISSLTDISS